jgi:hypothetical protein
MSESRDPVERALDFLVYAPIGIGSYVIEMAPSFVDSIVARGRSEFERRSTEASEHVHSARGLGQVAIAFGLPKLRARAETRLNELMQLGQSATTSTRPGPTPVTSSFGSTTAVTPPRAPAYVPRPVVAPVADAPDSDELPIPGYDALSASQVVERLAGLAPGELDQVHAYEASHRQRRTILGKIEQLAG